MSKNRQWNMGMHCDDCSHILQCIYTYNQTLYIPVCREVAHVTVCIDVDLPDPALANAILQAIELRTHQKRMLRQPGEECVNNSQPFPAHTLEAVDTMHKPENATVIHALNNTSESRGPEVATTTITPTTINSSATSHPVTGNAGPSTMPIDIIPAASLANIYSSIDTAQRTPPSSGNSTAISTSISVPVPTTGTNKNTTLYPTINASKKLRHSTHLLGRESVIKDDLSMIDVSSSVGSKDKAALTGSSVIKGGRGIDVLGTQRYVVKHTSDGEIDDSSSEHESLGAVDARHTMYTLGSTHGDVPDDTDEAMHALDWVSVEFLTTKDDVSITFSDTTSVCTPPFVTNTARPSRTMASTTTPPAISQRASEASAVAKNAKQSPKGNVTSSAMVFDAIAVTSTDGSNTATKSATTAASATVPTAAMDNTSDSIISTHDMPGIHAAATSPSFAGQVVITASVDANGCETIPPVRVSMPTKPV
jgi:hypothetical protein